MDLTNNNISFLLEKEFKEYIATRKNRGHCLLQVITEGGSIRSIIQFTLQGNPLSCSCDIRWILSLNYQWSRLLRGADCADGSKMSDVNHYFVYHCIYIIIHTYKVSAVYLEQMCPPPSCPDYNSILNTFKSEGYLGFV